MKNTLKVLVVTLIVIIGFSILSCDSGTGSSTTKFEGKWVNTYALTLGYTEFSWTFTGNTCLCKVVGNGSNVSRQGTFTFTDTEITFVPAQANTWQGYTQTYTLTGNVLRLTNIEGGNQPNGNFEKQ